MTIEQIKSRIERARKEENWNDYDWALDSLLIACEALERDSSILDAFLDKYTLEAITKPSPIMGHYILAEFMHCGKRAERALTKIRGEGEGK
jgi:hypothetical protein